MSEAEEIPKDAPRCPECGYLLYGLPEWRCPECGTKFHPEDFADDPCQDELRRLVRKERLLMAIGVVCLLLGVGLTLLSTRRWRADIAFCFTAPLLGVTIGFGGYKLATAETYHSTLLAFGIIWLLHGLALWLI